MIFCSILAPSNYTYPFLQFRVKNKENDDLQVYMALCKTCAEKKIKNNCNHRCLESKCFTSTWTIPEITYSLSLGYKIINIFEIHFFQNSKPLLRKYIQCLASMRYKFSFKNQKSKKEYCQGINAFYSYQVHFAWKKTS